MAENRHAGGNHSPEPALLGFLHEGPAHGYDLHRRLVTDLGQVWHSSLSQTYSILKRLEARGDITSRLVGQDKLPPRQVLRLTAAGSRRFRTWLEQPTGSSVHAIRVELLTRLYFVRRISPEKVDDLIRVQADEVRRGLERLQAARANMPQAGSVNELAIDFRIVQLRSVLDWLESARPATTEPIDTRRRPN